MKDYFKPKINERRIELIERPPVYSRMKLDVERRQQQSRDRSSSPSYSPSNVRPIHSAVSSFQKGTNSNVIKTNPFTNIRKNKIQYTPQINHLQEDDSPWKKKGCLFKPSKTPHENASAPNTIKKQSQKTNHRPHIMEKEPDAKECFNDDQIVQALKQNVFLAYQNSLPQMSYKKNNRFNLNNVKGNIQAIQLCKFFI